MEFRETHRANKTRAENISAGMCFSKRSRKPFLTAFHVRKAATVEVERGREKDREERGRVETMQTDGGAAAGKTVLVNTTKRTRFLSTSENEMRDVNVRMMKSVYTKNTFLIPLHCHDHVWRRIWQIKCAQNYVCITHNVEHGLSFRFELFPVSRQHIVEIVSVPFCIYPVNITVWLDISA